MKIENIKIDDLIPYSSNSRTHSPEQVQQIASSIKEFGFTNPILIDEDNGIIAGHGRLMGARLLKIDEVPTIRLSHLSEAQKKAYVISDNKIALNAGWDEDLLRLELLELNELDFDYGSLGLDFDFEALKEEVATPIDEEVKVDEEVKIMVTCKSFEQSQELLNILDEIDGITIEVV